MVVGEEKWWLKDLHREQALQFAVDQLDKISYEMYLKQGRPPLPVPVLSPEESEQFLKRLKRTEDFYLTPAQQQFYRDASAMRRLKRGKRHTRMQSGGMIRMPDKRPEPKEAEEESMFGFDDEMHGPVTPVVKPQPELQRSVSKVERPEEEPEEEEEEVQGEDDGSGIDFLLDDWSTTGTPELGGYAVDLEVHTDEDGDKTAVLTIDNVTIEIILDDFIEIVEALKEQLPRMREMRSS